MNKFNYQFDYVSIRHTNITNKIKGEYNRKFREACIYNAINDRNVSRKDTKAKDWEPSVSDKAYANSVYGEWEKYNKGIDSLVSFFDIYCEPVDKKKSDEYRKSAEEIKADYVKKWNQTEGFDYSDRLNYSDKVSTRYYIFTDLFFRETVSPYKPTIEYNVWDDILYLTDGRILKKSDFEGYFIDYGSNWLIDPEYKRPLIRYIDNIYDDFLRDNDRIYAYDPVKRYLDSLPVWDGEKRLDTFFIKYQEADDTLAVREMTRLWFMNAVRAIYMPSKFPFLHMLVLQGESNCGKSKMFERIFKIDGRDRYQYNISMDDSIEKSAPKFQTTWAIGFGEREGIDRVSINRQKQFMDTIHTEMSYQKKYQNEITKYLPHNVVFVTTNDTRLLNDQTVAYNKRNWIIHSNITEKEFQERDYFHVLDEIKDQLWAEAKYYLSIDWNQNLEPSAECIEGLKDIQKDYNAIDVEEVKASVLELLTRDFYQSKHTSSRGEYYSFESKEDFMAQFRCLRPYTDWNISKHTINRIPSSYISAWIKYNGYDSRHKRYIKEALMEMGFTLKRSSYNNCSVECWCKCMEEEDLIGDIEDTHLVKKSEVEPIL